MQTPCLFFLHPFAKPFVTAPPVEWTSVLPLAAAAAAVTASLLVFRRLYVKRQARLSAEQSVKDWINALSNSKAVRLFVSDGTLYVSGVANLGPRGAPEKFYKPDLSQFPPESFDFIYYEESFFDYYAKTPEELEYQLWGLTAPGGVFVHARGGKVGAVLRKPMPPL